jgi:hypothetical protein
MTRSRLRHHNRAETPPTQDTMPAPQIIHQFKITLLNTHPAIWPRIQVPGTYTFTNLHAAIQIAMGWENAHLHMFRIGKRSEIIIKGDDLDADLDDENTFNGSETGVARFIKAPGDRAIYEYDMGDSWLHEVLLEGLFLKEKGIKYPRCIAGARACPPEDCGGTSGYAHILEVLASPRHPERGELIEWLGDEYEPEKFDLETVRTCL